MAADHAPSSPTTFNSVIKRIARIDAAPALVSGQVLGGGHGDQIELLERLGGGGMGIVFRARDRRLGRDVAVKVLRANDADGHLRALFDREARATAQLLHPNIVTLHHVGEHLGAPYLVLELLVGETLATRLARRGALGVTETAAIADGVLAALAFAHERGVLHRDLKPHNVFVTVDERVKVLDFGVALSVDTDPGPVTRSAGTPGYMAPEHVGGGPQDARTDVWAAALLVVECLLGRRPIEQDAAATIATLDAPPAVKQVLARALDADPEQRPASARALWAELADAMGVRPDPTRARRRWRRTLLATFACVLAGAAALVVHIARAQQPSPTRPVTADEINGRAWHVNFGELRIHVEPDGSSYGVYDHRDGIQEGRFEAGRWIGWWCQAPTRRPPDDAGPLELDFVRGAKHIMIDGAYKYGDGRTAAWRDDFYGTEQAGAPSYALEQRLQHHEPCPPH